MIQQDSPIIVGELTFGESRIPIKLLIDTGSDHELDLNRPFGERNHLYEKIGWKDGELLGLGGNHTTLEGLSGTLRLDGHDIEVSSLSLSKAWTGRTAIDLFDGILGNPILGRYLVVFDCANSRVFLDPVSAFTNLH